MAAFFTFTVTPDEGEPFELEARTRDVLVWEKAGKDRSMAGLLADLHLEDLYRIAHIAATRQKLFEGNGQQFQDSYDLNVKKLLEEVEDEDYTGPDPTQQAPTAGES